MSRFHLRTKRRKLVALFALLGVLAAGGALAYFLTHATTPSANRATVNLTAPTNCTAVSASPGQCSISISGGSDLYPGSPDSTFTFTIDGGNSSPARTFNLGSPSISYGSPDSSCDAALVAHPGWITLVSGSAVWTQLAQPGVGPSPISGVGAQTLNASTSGNSGFVRGTFAVRFTDDGTDQSVCSGKLLTVGFNL